MKSFEDILNLIGSIICHQMPSRTIFIGSKALPVCARDTGIYTGIFTGALFLMMFRRLKSQKLPGTMMSVIMCLFMVPMITDGLLSYMNIIRTNNVIRLFTGAFFGLPIPFFLVPAANYSISGDNNIAVLKNKAELIAAYTAVFILCMLQLKGFMPYEAAGLIFITSFLFLLSRLSYTILARSKLLKQKMLYACTFFATVCIIVFLFFISSNFLQPIKGILTGG